jgi:hypothetical protein
MYRRTQKEIITWFFDNIDSYIIDYNPDCINFRLPNGRQDSRIPNSANISINAHHLLLIDGNKLRVWNLSESKVNTFKLNSNEIEFLKLKTV